MVKHTELGRLDLAAALTLREQTSDLLNRLMTDREQSERRMAETGKRDPMKFVTGATALENAISSTRELLGKVDELVVRLSEESLQTAAPHSNGSARPVIRSVPKPTQRVAYRPVHAVATP